MTTDRRLKALDSALSPTELVCRWLDEAHGFGELHAYVAWVMDQPDDAHPPDRLLREAAEGVRARLGRTKPADVDAAVRQAYRETLFRFELGLRINVVIHEILERETLLRMVLVMRFGMLLEEEPDGDTGRAQAEILQLMDGRARYLRQLDAARIAVEGDYLAGHPALFPAEIRRWDEARHHTDQMVAMQARLGELDGWLPDPELDSTEAVDAAVGDLIEDFVEPAKVHALEKLDEGRRAFSIATRWLRPKLETGAGVPRSVQPDKASRPTVSGV